jgi:hypothetical protein
VSGAAQSDSGIEIRRAASRNGWPQQFLLFALFFAGLALLHAPLLRLPYFWDEAGYYVPVARDLFLTGSPIPHSTVSNAHPPLVMAWLALAWKAFGYSPLVTRMAMLGLSAFALLGLFRLARSASHVQVAWATTLLVAIYPVYFTQSSMALVDLPAAGFCFWGLGAYIENRPRAQVVWFSLAALAKETAIVVPVALFVYEEARYLLGARWARLFPPERRVKWAYLIVPVLTLAVWFGYHWAKTGYVLGNPDFFRYNVAATVNPLRIPFAFGMRLWQLFGYLGLYLLTLAAVLAARRPPGGQGEVEGTPVRIRGPFVSLVLIYSLFMSVVGGAVLARYMLPVVPLVILMLVASLQRRVRYWRAIVGAVAVALIGGLFWNPPYGFSIEDNLAYRDYVVMHAEAANFLARSYPGERVLTAWPASDELARPWLGYVRQGFPVVRVENFSAAQIDRAAGARKQFDVALVFSTKYEPPHTLLENWAWWQRMKEQYFDYHRDLIPEEIAHRLGGSIIFHKSTEGQWIAVIEIGR